MKLTISESVGNPFPDGTPSANRFDDVLVIQYLLNQAAVGLTIPLPLDGTPTPALIQAISDFESTIGLVDGRIDPDDDTLAALSAVALSEFEGITDRQEQRSIILRPLRPWNFTRGDFKTLTELAGLELRFDLSSVWLHDVIKQRLFILFNELLDPSQSPASTWGVHPFDWYHCHLGLWSGTANVPISPASSAWLTEAVQMRQAIDALRTPFTIAAFIPVENVPAYSLAYAARIVLPDVLQLLESYAALPEAVIVHHTFEEVDWRPKMDSGDVRRNWMVTASEGIETPPYRTNEELNQAQSRGEFICEGAIQVNFLIDKSGVIHPVLGNVLDLSVVTGLGSKSLRP